MHGALRDGARANAADARKGLSALHMAAGAGDGAELVAQLLLALTRTLALF